MINKLRNLTTLILLSLLLSSCLQRPNVVGTWEFTKSVNKSDDYNNSYDPQNYRAFITFTSDNHFILAEHGLTSHSILRNIKTNDSIPNNGITHYGTYKLNDKQLVLTTSDQLTTSTKTIKIQYYFGDIIYLKTPNTSTSKDLNKEVNLQFKRTDPINPSVSDYNYTNPKYHQWRQKATQKQSVKQINKRIIQALDYSITYLKFTQQYPEVIANTYFLNPIPLEYYGNGISLPNFSQTTEWNQLFYNIEDAHLSHENLAISLRNVKDIPKEYYKKPLALNLYILEQMHKNLTK